MYRVGVGGGFLGDQLFHTCTCNLISPQFIFHCN